MTPPDVNLGFCRGSVPDLAGGTYVARPDPIAVFKLADFKGVGEGKGKGNDWEKRGNRRERQGKERKWGGTLMMITVLYVNCTVTLTL